MHEHWISAETALSLIRDRIALCTRAHFGLVQTRARLFVSPSGRKENAILPTGFWWAKGHEALDQNWRTGDFGTWIDRKWELKAFGVRFALSGILEMLPAEKRAETVRSLSVAGHAEWITAHEAVRAVGKDRLLPEKAVQAILIENGRLGLLQSRAMTARLRVDDQKDKSWEWEEAEWDVPAWLWQSIDAKQQEPMDWELGRFRGFVLIKEKLRIIELNGIHFLRASLPKPVEARSNQSPDPEPGPRPATSPEVTADALKPLSEVALNRWWESLASRRDSLTQDKLLDLCRKTHPNHSISRGRIRALTGLRKPGRKPIRGNPPAK